MNKPVHDDDCLCRKCTERLLAAHRRYMEEWLKRQDCTQRGGN